MLEFVYLLQTQSFGFLARTEGQTVPQAEPLGAEVLEVVTLIDAHGVE